LFCFKSLLLACNTSGLCVFASAKLENENSPIEFSLVERKLVKEKVKEVKVFAPFYRKSGNLVKVWESFGESF